MKIKLHIILLALLFFHFSEAQTKEFYGMTPFGGTDNLGVIFKTDANGENQTVVYNFAYSASGKTPGNSKLCEVNGKLYGTTEKGGISDMGVLYEYNLTTQAYIKLHDFDGANSGRIPYSNVILASNGKLYGTTLYGGINDLGTLFEYDIATNTLTKKLDFDGANMGMNVYANVIQAANGKLYGLTNRGGTNGVGVLYEYDYTTETFTKLLDFETVSSGIGPTIMVEVENNILYGTGSGGGANNNGTIFEYNITTSTFTKKFDFESVSSGYNPTLTLMKASNGNLYGLTRNGGLNNLGVLYEYNISTETFTKKFDFSTETGSTPNGRLQEALNGKLYGLTFYGGLNNYGVIFEFDPATVVYTKKLDFDTNTGTRPNGSFMQASNGKLYATTTNGGAGNSGVIFEYDTQTDNYVKKINFNHANMGSHPLGSLFKAENGKFYGLTSTGGTDNIGVLFEYNPIANTLINKVDFNGINGSGPEGSLMQASNGKLYGMIYRGGTNNHGVIFEFDAITDAYTKKFDFNSAITGSLPSDDLMQATNGKLYGLAPFGGEFGGGVLFEYDLSDNSYTNKVNFGTQISPDGSRPRGSLLQASNGNIYGITTAGGINAYGTLFEYNITVDSFAKKHDFLLAESHTPYSSLIQATNGKLYGTTTYGGLNNRGSLYEYDPVTEVYTEKIYFGTATIGSLSYGDLFQASNSKLYGMNRDGGGNNFGVLFEYDIATEIINKKLDFNGVNGEGPLGSLVEVTTNPLSIQDNNSLNAMRIYPNPVANNLMISSKNNETFQITIFNILGSQVLYNPHVANNEKINLAHLQSGLYVLKAISKNGNVETIKFIKN